MFTLRYTLTLPVIQKTHSMMKRQLDKIFKDDLLSGQLTPLLNYVKRDNTLILEIRGDYINIYYRGGMVLRVTQIKGGQFYIFEWDKKYAPDNKNLHSKIDKIKKVSDTNSCQEWITLIPQLTKHMDEWFIKHPKKEKFIQQEMVISGTLSKYLLTDFEYQKGKKARFDLMGIKLDRNNSMLSFIELKQGYSSLRTRVNGNKKTSGLKKHLEDIIAEITNENDIDNEISQANSLFEEKKKLGLIPNVKFPSGIHNNQIEVLFVIADYKTSGSRKFSSQLQNEINDIQSFIKLHKGKIKLHLKIMFLKTNTSNTITSITGISKIEDFTKYEDLMNKLYN